MSRHESTDLRNRPVGDVVAEDYTRATIFKSFGIDFCCGGGRTVGEACERKGVAFSDLEAALEASDRPRNASAPDTRGWPASFLIDYIVNVHHRYCRETLPVLQQFAMKVSRVHGGAYPALVEVNEKVQELAREMAIHMEAEEEEVFPAIASGGSPGSIEQMEADHDHAGALMRDLRELTSDFTPPDGACATWRATFAKLEEFENDLHRHVHLENNVLFRAARAG